jgi:hypothetical protein
VDSDARSTSLASAVVKYCWLFMEIEERGWRIVGKNLDWICPLPSIDQSISRAA